MKRLIFIAMVAMIGTPLVAIAQEKPDSLWIYFDKGSLVVPPEYSVALKDVSEKIKAGWSVEIFAAADSLLWRDESKKKSPPIDGGLIVVRARAVAEALDLKYLIPGVLTGHKQRVVLVVLTPPAVNSTSGNDSHLAELAKIDSANDVRFDNIEDRLTHVEGKIKFSHLSLGVGGIGIYYSQNNYAVVPTGWVGGKITESFGWQTIGGILPTGGEMYEGVAILALFLRPFSFLKVETGYFFESYFDKNLQWGKDTDRTDAAILFIGFEKTYKKVSGEISLGGFRDLRNWRWGMVNSLTISINF